MVSLGWTVSLLKCNLFCIIGNSQVTRDLIWVTIIDSWSLTQFQDLSKFTDLEPFGTAEIYMKNLSSTPRSSRPWGKKILGTILELLNVG